MITPIATCPPCQTFADTIDGINKDIEDLEVQSQNASVQGKAQLLTQRRGLRQQLLEQVRQLRQCELANNYQPSQSSQSSQTSQTSQPLETVTATWNATATIWTSNSSYPGPYVDSSNTTLTFTGNPGSIWNVSNDTFSLSITKWLMTITITLQKDSAGQTVPITGTFTPLSNATSPGSMDLSAPLHADAGLFGSSDIVLPLSTSSTITTPTGVFTGQALDANGNITLVGQANAVGGPLDTDLVQTSIVGTIVNAPPA
jgi:hypothetical protein